MKLIKEIMAALIISAAFTACSVQQFTLNTTIQPFQNGDKLFEEKTKGKIFKKQGGFFVLGANVINCETKKWQKI